MRISDWSSDVCSSDLKAHLIDPRSVVPESIMPPYAFLAERELKAGDKARDLTALYRVGVPYTKIDIAKANYDIRAQADPNAGAGAARKSGVEGKSVSGRVDLGGPSNLKKKHTQ